MASCGNPSAENDALMQRRKKYDKSKTCVKCKAARGSIVIRHAVYCRDCFTDLLLYRSRRILDLSVHGGSGKKRIMKAPGNLMIGYSGGLGSSVLLDLVTRTYFTDRSEDFVQRSGVNHPRHTRVWENAYATYIDISAAFEGLQDHTEEARNCLKRYPNIELVSLRLENAFDASWWRSTSGGPEGSLAVDLNDELALSHIDLADGEDASKRALRQYLSSLPTQTAVHSAVQTLIRMLLLHTAVSRGCSHLALGTSLTSLSVSLIASISQGGGFAVREELGEDWVKEGARLKIIRPLHEIGMKECAAWAWWESLPVVGKQKIPGGKNGITSLTKDFIVGLEKDYPSTVSTIARTCAKLAPKQVSEFRCALCQRPAQPDIAEWKGKTSIRSLDPDEHAPSASPSLSSSLCYACHTTLTSRSSRGAAAQSDSPLRVPLPVWIADDQTHRSHLRETRLSREQMKATIADCLLDE
ncbi:uncharacterized protein SCHCODRAFT_02626822 [Schizophyllum commune H4-8]|uniref:uncharacterized protein n=1 Tax=Schizophyllum commune (strain H4-8 / FGSC 9210) TaxID=578458 RepID=UPI0021600906|nr:uncharacterized protein SCHCODRAFT_02626822 [Schizophyllum commune H4-8]KAI5892677.1 hypothetical protein SCHCODRAFT_02626822 [Schizophyllum commune H4-8]